jgi:hypothetical protein
MKRNNIKYKRKKKESDIEREKNLKLFQIKKKIETKRMRTKSKRVKKLEEDEIEKKNPILEIN